SERMRTRYGSCKTGNMNFFMSCMGENQSRMDQRRSSGIRIQLSGNNRLPIRLYCSTRTLTFPIEWPSPLGLSSDSSLNPDASIEGGYPEVLLQRHTLPVVRLNRVPDVVQNSRHDPQPDASKLLQ